MNMLEDLKNRERPFKVPDGYFASVEDGVREAINQPVKGGRLFLSTVRSGLALAFSFLLIFGIGYGVMSVTDSFTNTGFGADDDALSTLIEGGYIRHDFVDYLYEEIELDGDFLAQDIELDEEFSQKIEEGLTEDDLIEIMEEYEDE